MSSMNRMLGWVSVCWLLAWGPTVARAQVDCGAGEPDVLIVLDRSGSMGEDGKWPAALRAIDHMLDVIGNEARLGLQLFSIGGGGCGDGQPREAVRVECAIGTGQAIRDALAGYSPGGGTPIAPAIDRARTYLEGIGVEGRRQYVVLITDGRGCNDDEAAVRRAWEAGITTLVVGFGVGVSQEALAEMADVGSGGAHDFFFADQPDDLERVLGEVGLIVANEVCNGEDDDCDGVIDENDPGGGGACESGLPGPCRAGAVHCVMGSLQCVRDVDPIGEACDGVDNDCDGDTDEGDPEGGGVCLVPGGQGQCTFGIEHCLVGDEGPSLTCVPDALPRDEQCNGLDDDCDGAMDEDIPGSGSACVSDQPGLCSGGRLWCENGELLCVPDVMPVEEACDGLDNDCDGYVDEVADEIRWCATGERGRCASGIRRCALGEWVCQAEAGARAEVCDGVDDDCDGLVDEGTRDACGWCAGEAPVETCDGSDDDCDGVVDEGDLCAAGWVCVEGRCAEPCPPSRECLGGRLCSPPERGSVCVDPCELLDCGDGAFCVDGACVDACAEVRCADAEVCHNGRCVADTCAELGCPVGEVCRGEVCVADACAGVTCPVGMFCRGGVCTASCAAVSCAGDERCVEGACVPDACGAMACAEGLRCEAGVCVDDPCVGVTCAPTFACVAGFCAGDPCAGVVCERGERCAVEGDEPGCVRAWVAPPPEVDPCEGVECPAARRCEVYDGEAFCVATPPEGGDGGGVDGGDGGGGDGGGEPDGGPTAAAEAEAVGCACRADGGGSAGAGAWLLLLLLWRRRALSAGRAS